MMAYLGHIDRHPNIYHLSQEVIDSLGHPVDLLFDLGARHGEGLSELGSRCSGDYVMVEPAPDCVPIVQSLLMKRIERVPQAHLFSFILGREEGELLLHTFQTDDDQSANLFSDRGGRYGDSCSVSVRVRPYDVIDGRFPGRRIGFMKVNIEGGEYQLVEDGFFHDRVDAFVMEMHNGLAPDRSWRDAVDGLSDAFDITTYGDLGYKYCFASGVRCA